MEPEGMVHALEKIHRLLRPDGVLIDIHPAPDLPRVQAYQEGRAVFSEALLVSYLEGIRQAERALAQVVRTGIFSEGEKMVIDFRHIASSPAELHSHWEAIEPYSDTPKDPAVAASEELVFSRLEAFSKTTGSLSNFAFLERAAISCFRPEKG